MPYKTTAQLEKEFEEEFSIDFLNLKKDFKEAILSQRQQDREAIIEWGRKCNYVSPEVLENLLSFLDELEGE